MLFCIKLNSYLLNVIYLHIKNKESKLRKHLNIYISWKFCISIGYIANNRKFDWKRARFIVYISLCRKIFYNLLKNPTFLMVEVIKNKCFVFIFISQFLIKIRRYRFLIGNELILRNFHLSVNQISSNDAAPKIVDCGGTTIQTCYSVVKSVFI